MAGRGDLLAQTTDEPAEAAVAWQDIGRAHEDLAFALVAPPRPAEQVLRQA